MSSHSREYWDLVADDWSTNRPHALWRRHSDSVNSALLREWLPSPQVASLLKTDLFDEAVSEGLYPLLVEYAGQVVGIDVSQSIVDAAKKQFPKLQSHKADVRELPFPDASFDVVVSISTLDHFDSREDIQSALGELYRVLRPGGSLLLTLDNLSNPIVWLRSVIPSRLLLALGLVPYEVGTTCHPRQLKAYCGEAGFEVLQATAIMHCPRVMAVAGARLLAKRGSERAQSRYLRILGSFENLGGWPTRFISGHFTAVRARKPG